MLVKKALKNIPPCERTKAPRGGIKEKYLAGAQIREIQGCGKILTVDYYSSKDGDLQVRFFCDTKNYITYRPKDDKWAAKYMLSCEEVAECGEKPVYADLKSIKLVNDFLNDGRHVDSFYSYGSNYSAARRTKGIAAAIDRYIHDYEEEQRRKAAERREALFDSRRRWFPGYDSDIDRFCNERAFEHTYIFFSNLDKQHKRRCVCGFCGHKWETTDSMKHKGHAVCPKCGRDAISIAERYQHMAADRTTICTAYKHDGQLIMRWAEAQRWFVGFKPQIRYYDDAYTYYLVNNGKPKIVSYFLTQVPYYYGYTWAHKNGETCNHRAYVYDGNLNEVFGSTYYNVDLSKALSFCKCPINFIGLLDRLKSQPQAEYLCKMGLTALASVMTSVDYEDGKGFEGIMGVSKQYLAMYREENVLLTEHRIIKAASARITPDTLERYRNLEIESFARTARILEYMTLDTLCAYVERQLMLGQYSASGIIEHLADYYDMLYTLKIPIDKHTVRPRDLKQAHDILVQRYNVVMADIRDKASQKALEYVNRWFTGYEKDGLCIAVPHERADFLREGQSLSHCVGGDSYYQNHIKGSRMIFFIRHVTEPDTPYYTAEIDMVTFNVLQCYGFGDKAAPKEINKFIKDFARSIEQGINNRVRKAG